jgi:DNA mismatch endonuclease (patch repair protein)
MAKALTKEQRSANMARIRSKDTGPEMAVRRIVWGFGLRYRLHRSDLPGKPDLVFTGRRKTVLVHGCFWHSHYCREGRRTPKSNVAYWSMKRCNNVLRDRRHRRRLRKLGWRVLVIWECETHPRRRTELAAKLRRYLTAD